MSEPRGVFIGSGPDKLGRQIDVFWERNMDEDEGHRAFISHQATAWHEGVCLGYLRIEYADADRYTQLYPTLWNHIYAFGGTGVAQAGEDPRELTGLAAMDFRILTLRRLDIDPTEDPGSYEAFEKLAKLSDSYLRHETRRKEFIDHNVNKPKVGYVDVGEFSETDLVSVDSRHLGIGKILYCASAIALHEEGMSLHSSTLQSSSAQRMWASMHREGWVEAADDLRQKGRMKLVADRIPESIFARTLTPPDIEGMTP